MHNEIKYLKEKEKKNITVVKIYLRQANVCRSIRSGVLNKQDYMIVPSQIVVK